MSIKAFPPWTPSQKLALLAVGLLVVFFLLGWLAEAEMGSLR